MSIQTLIIEPHYLPSIAVFQQLYDVSHIHFETYGRYQRQTYCNRAYILTRQGLQKLVVPVVHLTRNGLYKDVKIDYCTPWIRRHIKTLETSYNQTPYYATLSNLFYPVFSKKPLYLLDLNLQLIEACCTLLQISPTISLSKSWNDLPYDSITKDFRNLFTPKKRLPFPMVLSAYTQRFEANLSPKLSIIDLLASQGPYAHQILQ